MRAIDATEFGVYIHFPYCRKRCPYCDFAVSATKQIPHQEYATAIIKELTDKKPLFLHKTARSIYLGGGTPSLWNIESMATVVEHTKQLFCQTPFPLEITVECDPKDLSLDYLNHLKKTGVNRLSLGIQSLNNQSLQQLGRLHTAEEAKEAVVLIKQAGFKNLSVDLMIGLPQQTIEQLHKDVSDFLALQVEHLSIYQLTIEPNTAFSAAVRKNKLHPLEQEAQADIYQHVQQWLSEGGYEQYEISSYARAPKFRSVHNQLYWTGAEYLGVGVGAHSFRLLPDGSGERFANAREVAPYTRSPRSLIKNVALHEHLSSQELAREALWLGLRYLPGIYRKRFFEQHGFDAVEHFSEPLIRLQQRGWVHIEEERVLLTKEGILFADTVGEELLTS